MKCSRCQGTGKNITGMPVKAKVPGTVPSLDRFKLVQPLCPACGGTGKRQDKAIDE